MKNQKGGKNLGLPSQANMIYNNNNHDMIFVIYFICPPTGFLWLISKFFLLFSQLPRLSKANKRIDCGIYEKQSYL